MRAAARALESEIFAKVFASSLRRATEGAHIIAGDGAAILAIEEFVEIDFGDFEGLTIEEIRRQHPSEFERWRTQRLEAGYQYPGGESGAAFRARVRIGMSRMFKLWREGRDEFSGAALLVAHRGVIRLILSSLIGVTPAIELGSIHILDCDHGWRARALDLTRHLEEAAEAAPRYVAARATRTGWRREKMWCPTRRGTKARRRVRRTQFRRRACRRAR